MGYLFPYTWARVYWYLIGIAVLALAFAMLCPAARGHAWADALIGLAAGVLLACFFMRPKRR